MFKISDAKRFLTKNQKFFLKKEETITQELHNKFEKVISELNLTKYFVYKDESWYITFYVTYDDLNTKNMLSFLNEKIDNYNKNELIDNVQILEMKLDIISNSYLILIQLKIK